MKSANITFETFLRALKRQWKFSLVIVLAFLLLGAGAGLLYAKTCAAPAAGSAAPLSVTDLSALVYDPEYYGSCYNALSESCNTLNQYLKSLSSEKTLTAEQKEQLSAYKQEVSLFFQNELQPIKAILDTPNTVCFPPEFLEDVIAQYEAQLYSTRESLISAEIAVDIIKQMDSPDVGDDTVTKAYSSLLSEAAKYGSLKKSEARYTAILEKLSQSPEEVAADSRRVYAKLRAADRELAALTEEIDQCVQTLAADNHLDISTNRDTMDGSLQVVISHTHTVSEPEDIFLVTTLFCGLIGIFCGGFFAVCKEAFAEKKKKA